MKTILLIGEDYKTIRGIIDDCFNKFYPTVTVLNVECVPEARHLLVVHRIDIVILNLGSDSQNIDDVRQLLPSIPLIVCLDNLEGHIVSTGKLDFICRKTLVSLLPLLIANFQASKYNDDQLKQIDNRLDQIANVLNEQRGDRQLFRQLYVKVFGENSSDTVSIEHRLSVVTEHVESMKHAKAYIFTAIGTIVFLLIGVLFEKWLIP